MGALSGCNTDKVAGIVYKSDEVYTYSASAGVDSHLFYCWNAGEPEKEKEGKGSEILDLSATRRTCPEMGGVWCGESGVNSCVGLLYCAK